MSNRTSEANKAVTQAWFREAALVQQGQGTRNWTPQQQADILSKGKAYDTNGKAFEGHHMKSAEAYPAFQGEAGNIQFLSRSEHLAAHGGCFTNATNGYYNPVSGKSESFQGAGYTPCEATPLTNAVSSDQVISKLNSLEHDPVDTASASPSNVLSQLNALEHSSPAEQSGEGVDGAGQAPAQSAAEGQGM